MELVSFPARTAAVFTIGISEGLARNRRLYHSCSSAHLEPGEMEFIIGLQDGVNVPIFHYTLGNFGIHYW